WEARADQAPQFHFDRTIGDRHRRQILLAFEIDTGTEVGQRNPAGHVGEFMEERSEFVLGNHVLNVVQCLLQGKARRARAARRRGPWEFGSKPSREAVACGRPNTGTRMSCVKRPFVAKTIRSVRQRAQLGSVAAWLALP